MTAFMKMGGSMDRVPPGKNTGARPRGFGEADPVKAEAQAVFDRVLRGRFHEIPSGCAFASELPGIDSVVIGRIPSKGAQGGAESGFLHARYQNPLTGNNSGFTLSIDKNGTVMGEIPKSLVGVTKHALLKEALLGLDRIKMEFWVELDGDIFPKEEWKMERGDGTGAEDTEPSVLDPKRIEFLTKQQGAVQGFVSRQRGGFEGYHGIIFDGFVVLEHPNTKNAAYFIDDIPPLRRPPGATREEVKALILEQPWAQKLAQPRLKVLAEGSRRVIHVGEWEEKIQKEIDERRAKYSKGKKREAA